MIFFLIFEKEFFDCTNKILFPILELNRALTITEKSMKKIIKHVLPSIFFSLMSFLNAEEDACEGCDVCCPPPCPAKDPCAKCAQLWPSCGPDWIVTPNAGPCVSCGADVFITAEFLYWTVRQDNMEFALTSESLENPFSSLDGIRRGKYFHADGKMEPGFKVGLGMMFDCDGWDLYANYTWLRTERRKTVTPPDNLLLFLSVGNISFEDAEVLSAKSKWKHYFNVIDLELGRNFFVSQCLHLRPHFGLKGTWQDQKWDVNSSFLDSEEQTVLQVQDLNLDYWGIGVRAGLDSAWHFTRCFSLVGEVAASVLWQRFEAKLFGYQQLSETSFFLLANLKNESHSLRSVIETFLGLRWEDWFCCDEYHYWIDAGWELQWWGDQNRLQKNVLILNGGDMGLQGFTLRVRFDF